MSFSLQGLTCLCRCRSVAAASCPRAPGLQTVKSCPLSSCRGGMSEAASPPTPPAPDPDAQFQPADLPDEGGPLVASPGLLPALGEDLGCLAGGLAAFAGEGLAAGAETDSEYELDDYEHVRPASPRCGPPRQALLPCALLLPIAASPSARLR